MTKGAARLREKRRRQVERYMRDAGPEKYHDLLIPDFDVGCKVCFLQSNSLNRCRDLILIPQLRDVFSTPATSSPYTATKPS
jgi:hypothetical protein